MNLSRKLILKVGLDSRSNLGLAPGMVLKFYSSVAKGLKLKVKKCWGKLVWGLFALFTPPIPNRVKNDLTHSCPVKTIKKEKYRFHCFIDCSVEVTSIVTAIVLENMFRKFEISCFYLWGNRVGEIAMFADAQHQPL